MRFDLRLLRVECGLIALCAATLLSGCGGNASMTPMGQPISVMLGLSKITLSQDGAAMSEQIFIDSTSETAMVSFVGLPAGVSVKYSASDTSPSGILIFMASNYTPVGMYAAKVTANSAGEMASAGFTVVIVGK
jgi:hypothetical protein